MPQREAGCGAERLRWAHPPYHMKNHRQTHPAAVLALAFLANIVQGKVLLRRVLLVAHLFDRSTPYSRHSRPAPGAIPNSRFVAISVSTSDRTHCQHTLRIGHLPQELG